LLDKNNILERNEEKNPLSTGEEECEDRFFFFFFFSFLCFKALFSDTLDPLGFSMF